MALRSPRSPRSLHSVRSLHVLHSVRSLESLRPLCERAVCGGVLAALVGGASMLFLRSTMQVRSVPERLMEWLLLFVPPGIFEAVLQRLGFDAKGVHLEQALAATL